MNLWNNWGGKGLLVCNPPHETGPVRAGCCVPCEVKIWVYPRLEIPPPLQASLPVTDHPRGEKLFLTSEPEWSFLQILSSCLLCTTGWLDRRSALLLQGEPAHDPLSSLMLPYSPAPTIARTSCGHPLEYVSSCFFTLFHCVLVLPQEAFESWEGGILGRMQRNEELLPAAKGSARAPWTAMLAGECGQRTAVFAASR